LDKVLKNLGKNEINKAVISSRAKLSLKNVAEKAGVDLRHFQLIQGRDENPFLFFLALISFKRGQRLF